jgi:hypothetical protein
LHCCLRFWLTIVEIACTGRLWGCPLRTTMAEVSNNRLPCCLRFWVRMPKVSRAWLPLGCPLRRLTGNDCPVQLTGARASEVYPSRLRRRLRLRRTKTGVTNVNPHRLRRRLGVPRANAKRTHANRTDDDGLYISISPRCFALPIIRARGQVLRPEVGVFGYLICVLIG